MIDYNQVRLCMANIVGFRNSDDACVTTIPSGLTPSNSGLYVTSLAGITPELIMDSTPKDYSDMGAYLTSVMNEEPLNAIKDFVKRHKDMTRARHLLDNLDVVKHVQFMADRVPKSGRFVGLEIQLAQSDSIAAWIRMIGVQFDTLNPLLTIYLYNTSINTPVLTMTIGALQTMLMSLNWMDMTAVSWVAKYKSMTTAVGSKYYVGYYENDLLGQAVDTKIHGDCCGNTFVADYNKYATVRGIAFASAALSGTDLPDMKQCQYTDQSFGLHLKMSITCDITDTICHNKYMFDTIVQKKVGLRILQDFLNTNRVNSNASFSRDMAIVNLQNLQMSYDDDLKAIQFDFTAIDKYCQPPDRRMLKTATAFT